MNKVKTMVQIPLDLLEKLIENNNQLLSDVERNHFHRYMDADDVERVNAYCAAIKASSSEAEKCKESQLQVMYHREFAPADNYDGLLKQARALQSITKTQQASLAFARKDAYDLSLQLLHANNDRLKREIEANSILTNEVERLKGILNNLRAHAIESVGSNDMEIPSCIWDIAMEEMDKIGG
jgi:hypothetical protein